MYGDRIFLGKWEEVTKEHFDELRGHQVEIRVLDQFVARRKSRMMYEGMFRPSKPITEDDFRSAEWRTCGDESI